MADTFNGHEVETIVLFNVAGDLTIGEPGSVIFQDIPIEHLNPLLGTVGRHGAISVTGVLEDSSLVAEDRVDPL